MIGRAPPIPRATARLQLHAGFTLFDAAATVPYYASLGISHVYVSPIQQARHGSMHGYDGTDPTRIDEERGGREGLRALVAALRAHAMGLIVDIVPNHLSSSLENPWWFDVLERGTASRYAEFFAIDRADPDPALRERVLAPFLAGPLDTMIARNAIVLRWHDERARIVVDVEGNAFPFAADAYATLLADAIPDLAAAFERDFDAALGALADALRDGALRAKLTSRLERASREELPRWLGAQHYVLCHSQETSRRLNWRRFFDIAELIALRSDEDAVFDAFHALIFELYAAGEIDGVRVDHIDGLADPAAYCAKLRARLAALERQRPTSAPPGPAYVVVEKILAEGEPLRAWPVDGTTGYDFMDSVGALLHDERGRSALDAAWADIGGAPYGVIEDACREEVLCASFVPELARARRAAHAALPEFERAAIDDALAALTIGYRRYRGYARAGFADDADRDALDAAVRRAVDRGADEPSVRALARLFGGEASAVDDTIASHANRAFQHLTAPLAARAIEDTAFYRYARLLSRNEVGATPSTLSMPVAAFHDATVRRAQRWPHAMLATATHDHKRGEDARMRIASLSGHAEEWRAQVGAWHRAHARVRARDVPDALDATMLYQTLAGCWPDATSTTVPSELRERLHAWQVKAIRERKQHGTWAAPCADYEQRANAFLDSLLDDDAFIRELTAFVRRIDAAAAMRSLTQTALRLTCPGVPDLYQGCDFWDFSLVDPDNRRPVDYALRRTALFDERADDASVLASWRDGRVKQLLIARLLRERAVAPTLFDAPYVPLQIDGPQAENFIAFAREGVDERLIVVAPTAPRAVAAENLQLAPAQLSDTVLVGAVASDARDIVAQRELQLSRAMPLADLLGTWPICVLRTRYRE
jgi:(1->4)-alpha-D-glucan 1-alpha-D-glucosylmutase